MNTFLLGSRSRLLEPRNGDGTGGSGTGGAASAQGDAGGGDNFYGSDDAGGDGGDAQGDAGQGDGDDDGREDFSAGGEGGEGGDDFSNDDPDNPENTDGDGQPTAGKQPAQPQYIRIDPNDLAAIRGTANQDQRDQTEPKLTPEQLEKLVNPVRVTDELVAAIGHEDPAVRGKALQQFADATVRNAVSLARLMIQRKEKEFEARLGPITQHHQQSQAQATKVAFYSQHKDLAKYEIIVKDAANEVEPIDPVTGREKSQTQIFKEVAALTRVKLAKLGIKLQQQNNQPNANHGAGGGSTVPKPNRFSSSGRSGGDQHSGKGKPNNADADIYAR